MRFKAEQMIDRKLFFSVAIVMVTQLVTTATPFPSDLQPISVVGLEDSQLYWTFQGVALENDTSRLGLDFQRMIRIQELLYIAARDHVFVLNLTTTHHTITPQQVLTWRSADVSKCTMRGRNSDECYNYIKVLVPRNPDTLFVCGTNAFNPACRNYRSSSLEQVGQELLGQARCPFESSQSNVALFAGGHFYSATVTDFQASDAVIYRSLGGEGRPVLRTLKYDSKWLREPHFLHAVEYGNYVYFFFSEIAVEHMAGGKVVYSRVARVCKNDSGGSPRVLDRYWTSFLKARLNCSVSGETFFYFDILQSVTNVLQINQRPAVIAVFTTQTNSIPGSAVCGFYLDEMERVFNGRFKEQKNSDSVWSSVSEETVPTPRPGSCAGEGSASSFSSSVQFPDSVLIFIKTHPLMDESVPAVNNQPLMTSTASRYKLTGIAVDPAAGPHQNRTVVFLGSEDGRVLKVLISSQAGAAHSKLLEELSVHDPARCAGGAEVVSLELDKEHHSLLVAFSSCVVRVPLSRCARHATCKRRCLLTHDPYCIWLRTGRCADIAPGFKAGFEQDIDGDGSELHDLCSDVMSSSEDDGTSEEEDSASGVERSATVLRWADVSHAWVLCVCVLLAFVCGGVVSVSLLWCYCAGRSRRARDTEASLPPALSLDSLAKLNRLLDARADKSDVTSLQIYSAGPPRRQPPLPPDSATELPIKTPRTPHSQWERSHTHLDAEVRLTQQVFPVPPDQERRDLTVMTSSSLLPGSRGWGAHDCLPPPRPLGVTGSRQHFYQRSSRGHLITGSALTRQHSYSQPPLTQHAAIRRTASMRPHPHADILKEF